MNIDNENKMLNFRNNDYKKVYLIPFLYVVIRVLYMWGVLNVFVVWLIFVEAIFIRFEIKEITSHFSVKTCVSYIFVFVQMFTSAWSLFAGYIFVE